MVGRCLCKRSKPGFERLVKAASKLAKELLHTDADPLDHGAGREGGGTFRETRTAVLADHGDLAATRSAAPTPGPQAAAARAAVVRALEAPGIFSRLMIGVTGATGQLGRLVAGLLASTVRLVGLRGWFAAAWPAPTSGACSSSSRTRRAAPG